MRGTINVPVTCVIIKNDAGKVLFVLRKDTGWNDGLYSLPGGHLENGESFKQAARREALEEVNIDIKIGDLIYASAMHMYDKEANRINVTFSANNWSGEPTNLEPDRHSEIAWLDPKNLPENVVEFDVLRVTSPQPYLEIGWKE